MTILKKAKPWIAKSIITSCLAITFTAFSTHTSAASVKCGARSDIIQVLETKYAEGRVGVGVSQTNTQAYEVFVSQSGSWTLMMTSTNGSTCIMATGHSWEAVDESIKLGQKS